VRGAPVAALGLTLLIACRGQADGVHKAEVLPTPVTGVVVTFEPKGHDCNPNIGCPYAYTLKLTNQMDRDVQVQTCNVLAKQINLALNTIGGVDLAAGATRTFDGYRYLKLPKNDVASLVDTEVTCEGLDWHGEPPV
jgi:hypothetical protein